MTCQPSNACVKNIKTPAKRANLLKALSSLVFLISTCTRQRAARANVLTGGMCRVYGTHAARPECVAS